MEFESEARSQQGSRAGRRSRPESQNGKSTLGREEFDAVDKEFGNNGFHNVAPRSRPESGVGSEPAGPAPNAEEMQEPFGFKNVVPRPREQRIAQGCGTKRTDHKDIELLEKDRLAHRRGGHYRYDPPINAVFPQAGTGSLSYADELDRFTRDAAAMEYEERQRTIAKKNAQIQKNAEKIFRREHQRWNAVEEQYQYYLSEGIDLKEEPLAARNKNSVPYNPITLKYDDTHEATMLEWEGKCIRHRAANRANTLYKKMHSQAFNLLTGEPLNVQVPVPERPPTPVKPPTPEKVGRVHRVDLAYGDGLE